MDNLSTELQEFIETFKTQMCMNKNNSLTKFGVGGNREYLNLFNLYDLEESDGSVLFLLSNDLILLSKHILQVDHKIIRKEFDSFMSSNLETMKKYRATFPKISEDILISDSIQKFENIKNNYSKLLPEFCFKLGADFSKVLLENFLNLKKNNDNVSIETLTNYSQNVLDKLDYIFNSDIDVQSKFCCLLGIGIDLIIKYNIITKYPNVIKLLIGQVH